MKQVVWHGASLDGVGWIGDSKLHPEGPLGNVPDGKGPSRFVPRPSDGALRRGRLPAAYPLSAGIRARNRAASPVRPLSSMNPTRGRSIPMT